MYYQPRHTPERQSFGSEYGLKRVFQICGSVFIKCLKNILIRIQHLYEVQFHQQCFNVFFKKIAERKYLKYYSLFDKSGQIRIIFFKQLDPKPIFLMIRTKFDFN